MFSIKTIIFMLLIFSCTSCCFCFLEVLVGVGSYAYQNAAKLLCGFGSCCDEREIPQRFEVLSKNLKEKIFGQPLVDSTVVQALKSHWDKDIVPDKALAISFHGGPGVGKNYVMKFIEEALYAQGMESPHVHNFNSRLDFPEVDKVNIYKKNLADWIKGNVSRCNKQLFVFDEVNQMPAGVLDVIKPFIDYFDSVNGISYKRSIFIFISNTGSSIINEYTYNLINRGIDRSNLKLDIFEKLIAQGAFNEKGGFHHSVNIKSNLIDHYVPFLPLMKSHVIMCIKEAFEKRKHFYPTEKQIQDVLDFIDWGPDSEGVFSKTGCKRINQKVGLLTVS